MRCEPVVKHTTEAVEYFLKTDGLESGTNAYRAEWDRRYRSRGKMWVERDDWDPKEPMPLYTYDPEEVRLVVLRREGEGALEDFWNAKHRHFEPFSADINDLRMIMRGTRDEAFRISSTEVQHPQPSTVQRTAEGDFPKVGKGYAFVGAS